MSVPPLPWLRLAMGNLRANRRRTAITLVSIAVGVAGLVFLWAFIDGINAQMVDNMTGYLTGDLKIHQAGFHVDRELNLALPERWHLSKTIAQIQGVAAVAPRVTGNALASFGDKSRALRLMGVDPIAEPRVTRLGRSLVKGRYLKGGNEAIIGAGAAHALRLKLGDQVALVVQAADGSIGADRFRIVGIFRSGVKRIDDSVVQVPLAAAQELYSLQGRLTGLTVRVAHKSQLPGILKGLKSRLGHPHLELLEWRQLLSSLVQMVQFHNAVTYIVIFVIFVLVAASIANTVMMSVMERSHEFGVMMALGTSGTRVLSLVLTETALLAVLGYGAGILLGLAVTAYFGVHGLDFTSYIKAMDTMPGLTGIVFPTVDSSHLLIIGIVVLVVAMAAAAAPALYAGAMTPLQAMGARRRITNRIRRLHSRISSNRPLVIFVQLALRAAFRNPKRSLITASATAFGLAAYLFLYAFADGFFEQMIQNSTQQLSGHVQIMRRGHALDLAPDLQMRHGTQLLNQLRSEPEIAAAAPRVLARAMVATATKSLPIDLVGIRPDAERQVTGLWRYMQEGHYVLPARNGVLIGGKLARQLGAQLGDKVIMTVQQASGELSSSAFPITGIYRTGSALFDSRYAFVDLPLAQRLLGLHPGTVSRIVIKLHHRGNSAAVAKSLTDRYAQRGLGAMDWEELLPTVVQMIAMSKVDFYLILAVVFLVVAIGVMNTMVMSVMERSRELGVMLALGTRGGQLMISILFEALFLALFGMLVGGTLGYSLSLWLQHTGIDLTAIAHSLEAIPGVTDRIHPVLIFSHIWLPSLLLFLFAVAISVLPAIRAAHLDPVEAIRRG